MDGRVTVAGADIAYTIRGSGRAVVLLHGWTCNRRFWREQIAALQHDHRPLPLDFRGHGDSGVPDCGYTLERLAEDVHEVVERLAVGPAVIVGHSMGGMVAQQLAIYHPEDLSGLVLITTVAADPDASLISRRITAEAVAVDYRTAFLRHFPAWFPEGADPDLVEWTKSEMLRTPERVAVSLVRAYQDLDFRPRLRDLRVPTLVIGARGDSSTPVDRSREIAYLVPGATLAVIEGAGHFVQLERPREVNRAILKFLSEHGL